MLITFVRSIILYVIVLVVMRLMGKREIGQLQPFELAIAIMIADLASVPMSEVGIPIINGIIPILSLLVMHLIISFINLKSIKMRQLICGKPSILIYRGKINEKVLIKERFTINELQERLRANNINNLADVEYAILETSGQVSIIQKPNKRTTIPEDFNIMPEYEGISYDLVVDGKIMNDNLKILNKTYGWLKKEVNKVFKDSKDREKMLKYIEEINDSLEELYGYLDGNKRSFTAKLNDFIQSYILSDENVKECYIDMLKRDRNKNVN